jgi:chemotaxis protein MotB
MADLDKSELIFIRRRSSLEGVEAKGGIWKIAYADFMTAMMAFFLVMWLINATNQEARESVASYFNPIKLTDSTPDRKGMNEARRVDAGRATEGESLRPQPEPDKNAQVTQRPKASPSRFDEAALFRDPYTVLSEIADTPPRTAQAGVTLDANRKDGLKGGEAYRDPFDPINWPMASNSPVEGKSLGRKEMGSLPFDEEAAALSEGQGPRPFKGKPDATVAPTQESEQARAAQAKPDKPDALKPVGLFADEVSKDIAAANRPPASPAETAPVSNEVKKLQEAIATALAPLGAARPVAEVRESNEGLLISLTDDLNYGMFATASAEPTPGLVRALDKITPLISQNRGQVIVRGHTDGRAFRSPEYDNWRLSTARAHMAYHMLIRGGLDARRIERIEGYADRRLKNPDDPSAAQNRRIELLIRAPLP